MLVSIVVYLAGLLGASRATSYEGLMAARVLHAFGSGVCEALPVQLVNDIFYLHERGQRIAYYTVCLCLGSTGPLYAGYMLAGGYSWRLFFYVEAAFAGLLLAMAFVWVEETRYKRRVSLAAVEEQGGGGNRSGSGSGLDEKEGRAAHVEPVEGAYPPRKTFLQTLKLWSGVDTEAEFWMTMLRPFSYFFVPAVLWVITTYGRSSGGSTGARCYYEKRGVMEKSDTDPVQAYTLDSAP
jgi:MFS family permease